MKKNPNQYNCFTRILIKLGIMSISHSAFDEGIIDIIQTRQDTIKEEQESGTEYDNLKSRIDNEKHNFNVNMLTKSDKDLIR